MLLLILFALVALVYLGVSFTIYWLFVIAAIVALLFVVSALVGGASSHRRDAWW